VSDIRIHRPQIQSHTQKLNQRKSVDDSKYIPDDHKEFAKNLESQFAQLMLKEMQKSIGSTQPKNTQSEFYDSLMIQERAKTMAGDGNSQLQEMILDEVYPKKFRNEANYNLYTQSKNKFNKNKIDMHDKPSLADSIEMSKHLE
jgi:Rod binding domain-containing protein